jgi:PhnB protein
MSVIPYITLNGRCAEALEFYGKALGATVEGVTTFQQSPMHEQTPPEWRGKVMHAGFTVAGSRLYAGDGMPGGANKPIGGVTFSIITDDVAEAERMFNALAEGGQVGMELQETFWAERFGMVTDQFGVPWMVNGRPKQAD